MNLIEQAREHPQVYFYGFAAGLLLGLAVAAQVVARRPQFKPLGQPLYTAPPMVKQPCRCHEASQPAQAPTTQEAATDAASEA